MSEAPTSPTAPHLSSSSSSSSTQGSSANAMLRPTSTSQQKRKLRSLKSCQRAFTKLSDASTTNMATTHSNRNKVMSKLSYEQLEAKCQEAQQEVARLQTVVQQLSVADDQKLQQKPTIASTTGSFNSSNNNSVNTGGTLALSHTGSNTSLVQMVAAASHKSRARRTNSTTSKPPFTMTTTPPPSSQRPVMFAKGMKSSASCTDLSTMEDPTVTPTPLHVNLSAAPQVKKREGKNTPPRSMVNSGSYIVSQTADKKLPPPPAPLKHQAASIGLGNKNYTHHHKAGKNEEEEGCRFWVGTWNMGAVDPFCDENGICDEQYSAQMLSEFIPHHYDLYILGVQEGVSENVYHTIVAYLNRNNAGQQYFRLEFRNRDFLCHDKSHVSDFVFDGAVRGRGDGAIMGTKFTGLAVFCNASFRPQVKLIRSVTSKFNIASGSKGGTAVALKLYNDTTLLFINCHLDAKNAPNRREQFKILQTQLAAAFGTGLGNSNINNSNTGDPTHLSSNSSISSSSLNGNSSSSGLGSGFFDVSQLFHHVVWMGDLNYRIHTLDAETVLHMLKEGRAAELHEKFDSLLQDQALHHVLYNYHEPTKWPDFYPTYKKFEKRHLTTQDNWPYDVYRVMYKEPFYKGGKVKSRVPGWCDRILTHSIVNHPTRLSAEKVYDPVSQSFRQNYHSINDGQGMDISDHSPVYCTFVLTRRKANSKNGNLTQPHPSRLAIAPASSMVRRTTVLRVLKAELSWLQNQTAIPKKMRLVTPLVAEDDNRSVTDIWAERKDNKIALNAVLYHIRPLSELHMLLWCKFEALVGHCVVSLAPVAKYLDQQTEIRYTKQLLHNSTPITHQGHAVKISFSLTAKMFVK